VAFDQPYGPRHELVGRLGLKFAAPSTCCARLRALAEAHAHGLVHRDVKPPNLIVSQLGAEPDWLEVVDFGIVTIEGGREAAVHG
jgi:serine/threonine protein kinase